MKQSETRIVSLRPVRKNDNELKGYGVLTFETLPTTFQFEAEIDFINIVPDVNYNITFIVRNMTEDVTVFEKKFPFKFTNLASGPVYSASMSWISIPITIPENTTDWKLNVVLNDSEKKFITSIQSYIVTGADK